MNALIILTFASCFLATYFARKLNLISVYFSLTPELLSGIILLVVLGRLILGRRFEADVRYLIFVLLLLLTLAVGIVVNRVPTGAVISGMRDYLPMLPLLLIGAVYPFTARQIRAQLIVLGLLLAIQVPIALYQRFVSYSHAMHTGDVVTGTVTDSGSLSILLVSGVAVLTVLYLRRRMTLAHLLFVSGFLLIPAMINETKATLIMLPVAMLAPILLMPREERALRRMIPLLAVFAVVGTVYVSVYNSLIVHRNADKTLQTFFLEGGLSTYIYKDNSTTIGRFDSIEIAMTEIAKTPMTAAFGLGAGNVATSMLPGFEGEYAHYEAPYKVKFTQMSMLLWNVGWVGVAVFVLLFHAMFRDAVLLARSGGADGMLGQAWAPVVIMLAMCMFYNAFATMYELIFPMMFYGGVIARRAYRVRADARRRAQSPRRDTVGVGSEALVPR